MLAGVGRPPGTMGLRFGVTRNRVLVVGGMVHLPAKYDCPFSPGSAASRAKPVIVVVPGNAVSRAGYDQCLRDAPSRNRHPTRHSPVHVGSHSRPSTIGPARRIYVCLGPPGIGSSGFIAPGGFASSLSFGGVGLGQNPGPTTSPRISTSGNTVFVVRSGVGCAAIGILPSSSANALNIAPLAGLPRSANETAHAIPRVPSNLHWGPQPRSRSLYWFRCGGRQESSVRYVF